MAAPPLSRPIDEYLARLELDRHASAGTVRGYRRDLQRFSDFVGGDVGVPDITELDRELLRGYQRHVAPARKAPAGPWRCPPALAGWSRCAALCGSPPAKTGSRAISAPP